jgi:SAM-dependent methyltransferase
VSGRGSTSPARRGGPLRAAARKAVFGIADRLSPNRRAAFLTGARAAARLVDGKPADAVNRGGAPTSLRGNHPSRYVHPTTPEPISPDWPEPPILKADQDVKPQEVLRSIYELGGRPERYDVELMELLNKEYESKPVVPAPPKYDVGSFVENGRKRIGWVHDMVDLRNKRVLEVGCGQGVEVWGLANHLGCDAYGVDVLDRAGWRQLAGPNAHFLCVDITAENPFPENFFDRVISFTVWEHIAHPYAALRETFKIMKPGGLQWIRANLYRGPLGSHLYHDIYFPWPHLVFPDDVIEEFYVRLGRSPKRAAWVNKLTWAEYERYIQMAGFTIEMVSFTERPIDEEFYARFEDVLGRYPRWDLEKDFFTAVLRKPE